MKKYIAMALALVLVAGLSIGGTVAYLQDTDSDVNTMTVGSVYIRQNEYQRDEGVAHDAGEPGAGNGVAMGSLVPFVDGQKIYPAVPKNNAPTDYSAETDNDKQFYWGEYVYSGTASNGLWDDSKLANVMDKMVFVENTGKSDAYFRTIIAVESPIGMTVGEAGQGAEIMTNENVGATYNWEKPGYITIGGARYYVMVATYQRALQPGKQSHPSLLQAVLTHHATNEDMEALGETLDILVLSQGVQTAGFENAETALNTAFGEATEANIQNWFGAHYE